MNNLQQGDRDEKHKKPRLLKKLPDWFRLQNYEQVINLDTLGWLQQINVRQACYHQLKEMRSEDPILPEEWNDAVIKAVSSSRKQPICSPTSPPFNGTELSWCFNIEFRPEQAGDGPVVREMGLLDLYKFEKDARFWWKLSREQIDEAEELVRHPSALRLIYGIPAWMNKTLRHQQSTSSIIPFVIDLSFPNPVLIEHFNLQVQRLRRAACGRSTDATRQTPKLAEWAQVGVLPCMDLLLWAEEKQGRLTDSLLTTAVCLPDEERMRKTLRPLAEELLSPGSNGRKAYSRFERSGNLEEWLHHRGIDGHAIMQRLRAQAYRDLIQRQDVRQRRARRER